jgi:pimeloyl-ACP methyl ester carboxylesterase/DNA-binding CsgD family transcriptional regulator
VALTCSVSASGPRWAGQLSQEPPIALQRIRYVRSADGVRVAWTESGDGPTTLIWPPNDYTSIAEDAANPIRAPILAALSQRFRVVRYDNRGFGSSERGVQRQGLTAWTEDLAAVVDAAAPGSPVDLFGMSQGAAAAIAFSVGFPGRVRRLIVHGGSPFGPGHASNSTVREHYDALIGLTRAGWSGANPGFRMWVTAGLVRDATTEEVAWFDGFYPRCTAPADAARFMEGWRDMDLRPTLPALRGAVLVTHNSGDGLNPASLGRRLAAGIEGALYVEIPGQSHVPRASDGSLAEVIRQIVDFAEPQRTTAASLSTAEQRVLDRLCEGDTNKQAAARLGIAEKTVRNHLTQIFRKLAVSNRTQALLAGLRARRDQRGEA